MEIENAGKPTLDNVRIVARKRVDYKAKYFTMRGWVALLGTAVVVLLIGFFAGAR
jgi:hypothetical protein